MSKNAINHLIGETISAGVSCKGKTSLSLGVPLMKQDIHTNFYNKASVKYFTSKMNNFGIAIINPHIEYSTNRPCLAIPWTCRNSNLEHLYVKNKINKQKTCNHTQREIQNENYIEITQK